MKRSPLFWPSVALLLGLAGYGGAAIIQAIVPVAAPSTSRRGTTTPASGAGIFQLAANTTAGSAGAAVCDDGNGNTTTSGCTANAVTSTSPVTVNTNTTNDQQLMELSLSAGYLNSLGRPFSFFGAGVYTTQLAQTPTLTFKIKLCTVSGCGSGTVVTLINILTTASVASITNNNWNVTATAVTAATGATGNLEIHGPAVVDLGATTATADSVFSDTNTAVSSNIDLTAALFVDFTIAFSTNAAGANTMTQREGVVSPGGSTAGGGAGVTFAAPFVTSGGNTFGPSWALTKPPLAGWTFDNQGASTNDTSKGYDYGHFGAGGATQIRMLYQSAPATPYSITVLMAGSPAPATTGAENMLAFGFRDSGGKWVTFMIGTSASNIALFVTRWNSATSFNANVYSLSGGAAPAVIFLNQGLFFKVVDDGTNITFNLSIDGGNHFQQAYTELRGAFLGTGPNAIGFGAYCNSTTVDTALLSWLQGTS